MTFVDLRLINTELDAFIFVRGQERSVGTVPTREAGSVVLVMVPTGVAVVQLVLCWTYEPSLNPLPVPPPDMTVAKIGANGVEDHTDKHLKSEPLA